MHRCVIVAENTATAIVRQTCVGESASALPQRQQHARVRYDWRHQLFHRNCDLYTASVIFVLITHCRVVMAGRKSSISVEELISVINSRKNELLDQEGNLNIPSHNCWANIVHDLKTCRVSAKYAYVFVKQNRHNVWGTLSGTSRSDEESSTNNEESSESSNEKSHKAFSITISSEKWSDLLQEVLYRSSDRTSVKKRYVQYVSGGFEKLSYVGFYKIGSPCF